MLYFGIMFGEHSFFFFAPSLSFGMSGMVVSIYYIFIFIFIFSV